MILLVLMSFILIAGYVFAMIKKMEEIPYSISDTYYALTHKFWFGLCMIGSGALLLPAASQQAETHLPISQPRNCRFQRRVRSARKQHYCGSMQETLPSAEEVFTSS